MYGFKKEKVRQDTFLGSSPTPSPIFCFQITYNMNRIEYYFIRLLGTLCSEFQLLLVALSCVIMDSTFLIVSHQYT
jgi:hypothetical protein